MPPGHCQGSELNAGPACQVPGPLCTSFVPILGGNPSFRVSSMNTRTTRLKVHHFITDARSRCHTSACNPRATALFSQQIVNFLVSCLSPGRRSPLGPIRARPIGHVPRGGGRAAAPGTGRGARHLGVACAGLEALRPVPGVAQRPGRGPAFGRFREPQCPCFCPLFPYRHQSA